MTQQAEQRRERRACTFWRRAPETWPARNNHQPGAVTREAAIARAAVQAEEQRQSNLYSRATRRENGWFRRHDGRAVIAVRTCVGRVPEENVLLGTSKRMVANGGYGRGALQIHVYRCNVKATSCCIGLRLPLRRNCQLWQEAPADPLHLYVDASDAPALFAKTCGLSPSKLNLHVKQPGVLAEPRSLASYLRLLCPARPLTLVNLHVRLMTYCEGVVRTYIKVNVYVKRLRRICRSV